MRIITILLLILVSVSGADAKLVSKSVEYKHRDTVLEGYLAYDDAVKGKQPGVLVVHEWWGQNTFAKQKADELARSGYVAFAVDMYGKGITTTDPKKAGELSGQFKGNSLMAERAAAGKAAFLRAAAKVVDPTRIGAIGFCFGGTTVLELAYSGADLKGVVSFHGHLPSPQPGKENDIKAAFLILHGADDAFVSTDDIAKFQDSMRNGKFNWNMYYFGNAVHSFTNPDAGKSNIPGVAYNKTAATLSWSAMLSFFEEIF